MYFLVEKLGFMIRLPPPQLLALVVGRGKRWCWSVVVDQRVSRYLGTSERLRDWFIDWIIRTVVNIPALQPPQLDGLVLQIIWDMNFWLSEPVKTLHGGETQSWCWRLTLHVLCYVENFRFSVFQFFFTKRPLLQLKFWCSLKKVMDNETLLLLSKSIEYGRFI